MLESETIKINLILFKLYIIGLYNLFSMKVDGFLPVYLCMHYALLWGGYKMRRDSVCITACILNSLYKLSLSVLKISVNMMTINSLSVNLPQILFRYSLHIMF